ncbi:MAG: HAD-IA family hydrolase [Prevotella sp.]|jgi:HAD superfamily hydrolase (TIGR01509 family)
MIKNIVYDFGGVLVQYDFMGFFTQLLGSREKAQWFLKRVFSSEVNAEMDRGVHEPAYYFEQQKHLWPEYSEALDAFDKQYADIFTHESEGIRATMLDLKKRGYRLLGLSNWSARVYDVMEKFDIFEILEDHLISKDVYQLKPEAEIYHSFLNKFKVQADECVFIDDKPENIEGARAVGMYGIVFSNTPQLMHELEPLLLPYTFEQAKADDEPQIWSIVHQAALNMVAKGRHQWDEKYPPRESIAHDIDSGIGYVIKLNGEIAGYTAISFDGEPSYDHLKGKWLSDRPYATIHRTAVATAHHGKGLARLLLTEAGRICRKRKFESIRIDTNYDNVEMLHLIDSLGFMRCGLCYYNHGGKDVERIACEKILSPQNL